MKVRWSAAVAATTAVAALATAQLPAAAAKAPAPASPVTGGSYTDGAGNSVTLNGTTILLADTATAHIRSLSATAITFDTDQFPQASQIHAGSVVLARAGGATDLLKVTSVGNTSAGWTVAGTPASLADAYSDLKLNKNLGFSLADAQVTTYGSTVPDDVSYQPASSSVEFSYTVAKNYAKEKAKNDTKLTADGSATLKGAFAVSPRIGMHVDLSKHEYAFHAAVTPTAKLTVDANGAFAASATIDVAHVDFGSKVVWIGPVPVELHPELDVKLNLNLSGQASFSATLLDYSRTFTAGVKYTPTSGWQPDNNMGTNTFQKPSITNTSVEIDATADISADLYIAFYEVAGPTFTITVGVGGHIRPYEKTYFTLEGHLSVVGGGKIEIDGEAVGEPFTKTLYDSGPVPLYTLTRSTPPQGLVRINTCSGTTCNGPATKTVAGSSVTRLVATTYGTTVSAAKTVWTLPAASQTGGLVLCTSTTCSKTYKTLTASSVYVRAGKTAGAYLVTATNKRSLSATLRVDNKLVTPPAAPTLTATPRYAGGRLAWTAATTGGPVGEFEVTVTASATTNALAPAATKQHVFLSSSARSLTLTQLAPKVPYSVAIRALNQAGKSAWATTNFTPYDRVHLVGDAAIASNLHTGDALMLADGASAFTVTDGATLGMTNSTVNGALVEQRISDGKVLWAATGTDGAPLRTRMLSTNVGQLYSTFAATPDGHRIVAPFCEQGDTNAYCTLHLYRIDRVANTVTKLPAALSDAIIGSDFNNGATSWDLAAGGKYLTVVAHDGTFGVWDLDSGAKLPGPTLTGACPTNGCDGGFGAASISADGSKVAFSIRNSHANDAAYGCLPASDMYVWDRVANTVKRHSANSATFVAGTSTYCVDDWNYNHPELSADGSTLAYYGWNSGHSKLVIRRLNPASGWNATTLDLPFAVVGDEHDAWSGRWAAPAVSNDGKVVVVPVSARADSGGAYLGASICATDAQVCTTLMPDASGPVAESSLMGATGAAQLSGDGTKLLIAGSTPGTSRSQFTSSWFEQTLTRP